MTAHERLRQLHADATPSPWKAGHGDVPREVREDHPGVVTVTASLSQDHPAAEWVSAIVFSGERSQQRWDDAKFIATLRNALPQLANLAEAAAMLRLVCVPLEPSGLKGDAAQRYDRALADLEQALNPTRNTQ